MILINLGCGNHYHNEWINVDFVKIGKNVIAHNLVNGIPFATNYADVIYNSHVFEHFSKDGAVFFLSECWRVLKPGGIIRIVVPDLENIAREYISHLEGALLGDKTAQNNYEWIMLELYDQVVRNKSGGMMVDYLRQPVISNANYIEGRISSEYRSIRNSFNSSTNRKKKLSFNILEKLGTVRMKIAKLILGRQKNIIDIGRFRISGENHLWMYDRFSLSKLLLKASFKEVKLVTAHSSSIPQWSKYNLDIVEEGVRFPSSLFIEAKK